MLPAFYYNCGPATDTHAASERIATFILAMGLTATGPSMEELRKETSNIQNGVDRLQIGALTLNELPGSGSMFYVGEHSLKSSHSIYDGIRRKYGYSFNEANTEFENNFPEYSTITNTFTKHDLSYYWGTTVYGGTSTAAPNACGIISLYLQMNPGANVKDVRKFLRFNNKKIWASSGSKDSDPVYLNYLTITQSITPGFTDMRYTNLLDGAVSGTWVNCTDNDVGLAHFPNSSGYKRRTK